MIKCYHLFWLSCRWWHWIAYPLDDCREHSWCLQSLRHRQAGDRSACRSHSVSSMLNSHRGQSCSIELWRICRSYLHDGCRGDCWIRQGTNLRQLHSILVVCPIHSPALCWSICRSRKLAQELSYTEDPIVYPPGGCRAHWQTSRSSLLCCRGNTEAHPSRFYCSCSHEEQLLAQPLSKNMTKHHFHVEKLLWMLESIF